MRFLLPIVLFAISSLFASCQKDVDEELVNQQEFEYMLPYNKDSLSFTIDGKSFASTKTNGFGFSNKQVNIRPYPTIIANREAAYSLGGYWWYGEKDSLIFEQTYTFQFADYSNFTLGFNKKYITSALVQKIDLKAPKEKDSIFNIGSQSYATDNNRENTKEGVSLEFSSGETRQIFTSFTPNISLSTRSARRANLQEDAYFEIIRLDTLSDASIVVEARFETNIFADEKSTYRIKDGFVRFKTKLNRLK